MSAPAANRNQRSYGAIYAHTCESMREIRDGTVALTVTSPPYWNAINYTNHTTDKTNNYRTRDYAQGFVDYESYLAFIQRIFLGAVWRATKEGGICALVLGTVLHDEQHYNLPGDLDQRLRVGGWQFREHITWHKTTGGVSRAGVAIQHPYPGYFFTNLMCESIYVFRKPGPSIYTDKTNPNKLAAQFPVDDLFKKEIANNVWHIPPVPPGFIDHPCPLPEEVPYRLIRLYSYPGDLVLDPFCGSGQVPKVARALGRTYIAYETEVKYAELARRRIKEPLHLRKDQLLARFDKSAQTWPSL